MKLLRNGLLSLVSMLITTGAFADAAEPAVQSSRQQNYIQTLLMMGAMVLFFYFVLLRPEQKRRKKLEQQRSSLEKGARVTAMGIVGIVDKVEEKTIILKMIDGSRIEVLKGAVTDVEAATQKTESCCSHPK